MTQVQAKRPISARPTSPHLQIYKFQITMFTSIFGRLCGFVTFASIISFVWLLMMDVFGGMGASKAILDHSLLSKSSAVFCLSLALVFALLFSHIFYFFALCRHLAWDFGYCLELKTSRMLSFAMLGIAFIIALYLTYKIGLACHNISASMIY